MTSSLDSAPVATIQIYGFVRKIFWIFIGSLVVTEIVIIRINIVNAIGEGWIKGVFLLVLSSTIPISLLIRTFIYIYPIIKTRYFLFENRLEIEIGKNRKNKMPFDLVDSVRLSRWPFYFGGGFVFKLTTGQEFTFLSILEKNILILDRFSSVKPQILSKDKLRSYILLSSGVRHWWSRVVEKMRKWQSYIHIFYFSILIASYLLISESAIRSISNHGLAIGELLVLGILGSIVFSFGLNFFLFEKAIHRNEIKRSASGGSKEIENVLSRDRTYERKILIGSRVLFYLISSIIFYLCIR